MSLSGSLSQVFRRPPTCDLIFGLIIMDTCRCALYSEIKEVTGSWNIKFHQLFMMLKLPREVLDFKSLLPRLLVTPPLKTWRVLLGHPEPAEELAQGPSTFRTLKNIDIKAKSAQPSVSCSSSWVQTKKHTHRFIRFVMKQHLVFLMETSTSFLF